MLRNAAYIIHDLSDFGIDAELLADERLTPEQGKHILSQLEATPKPNYEAMWKRVKQFRLISNNLLADQIESIVLRDPRPFHPQRLYEVCQTKLGTGIYRTKGFLWLISRPANVLLWKQSGSQISFELTSFWTAEAIHNRYGKLLPEEIALTKEQIEAVHPIFGDRHNTLAIIALPSACKTFAAALKGALCTEQEMQAWQRGETFTDPWLQKLRKQ